MATGIVYIGSDHAGFTLKETLINFLKEQKYDIKDIGTHSTDSCDYPVYAHKVCESVVNDGGKGILICGTGIGMSIAANRHPGIRAALCTHEAHALACREHNDANILCLGQRITAAPLACTLAAIFLANSFSGGRHSQRVEQLNNIFTLQK